MERLSNEMMDYLQKAKERYTPEEFLIFLHGYLFSNIVSIKEQDEEYKDKSVEEVFKLILGKAMEIAKSENESEKEFSTESFLFTDSKGNAVHCQICSSNVFIKESETICYCNSCQNKYEITKGCEG